MTRKTGHKALKTILDGLFNGYTENVLVYATSTAATWCPNTTPTTFTATRPITSCIPPKPSRKIALSERFGLWLSFYPFKQDDYLNIVDTVVRRLGYTPANDTEFEEMRTAALHHTRTRLTQCAHRPALCTAVGRTKATAHKTQRRVALYPSPNHHSHPRGNERTINRQKNRQRNRRMNTPAKIIDVVVGVSRNAHGEYLFAQRPEGKPMAGYWEFPGGKVEVGETHFKHYKRELIEELGITITNGTPWRTIEHVYPHAHVLLHFIIVTAWDMNVWPRSGAALAKTHRHRRWHRPHAQHRATLPATLPLLADLAQLGSH